MLAAREDHAPAEGVAALGIDQAGVEQLRERMSLGGEMTSQVSTGSVADAEFFNEGGITQPAALQILHCFGMAWIHFLAEQAARDDQRRFLARRQPGVAYLHERTLNSVLVGGHAGVAN